MTVQSRRVEICAVCFGLRDRIKDFVEDTAYVTLPRSCVTADTCTEEMKKPFNFVVRGTAPELPR